ncbi:urease accessory protein UreF [Aequitasia blattaphilus]|uniref:Urease accessory protein UreF n=1 Tax=Aequitasia blattaphilus TaxID=2949332 RepID=A0ABT1EBE5_9FIRM|nr:urease accessory UreF family protein [Aequitasia blattaphilus]MCP1102257.1 hypothetical protein [Aequitasia blattaphilus]MCR8614897.1 hypothetical protein [Aequitasia blattaphilus]
MNNQNILKLVQTLDPLFPIGGYTLSNGMETYVQKGIVYDYKTLAAYLDSYLYMLSFNDLAFAAKAYEVEDIAKLDLLCSSLKAPIEIRQGSIKQCSRFLKLHTKMNSYPRLIQYQNQIKNGECEGHYGISMGLFIKELNINLQEALELYCYSLISTAVNHAVKMVPLRQLDGQIAIYELMEHIPKAVTTAINTKMMDLGASGCGFDIRSMQHETLYTRLYIS